MREREARLSRRFGPPPPFGRVDSPPARRSGTSKRGRPTCTGPTGPTSSRRQIRTSSRRCSRHGTCPLDRPTGRRFRRSIWVSQVSPIIGLVDEGLLEAVLDRLDALPLEPRAEDLLLAALEGDEAVEEALGGRQRPRP